MTIPEIGRLKDEIGMAFAALVLAAPAEKPALRARLRELEI